MLSSLMQSWMEIRLVIIYVRTILVTELLLKSLVVHMDVCMDLVVEETYYQTSKNFTVLCCLSLQ